LQLGEICVWAMEKKNGGREKQTLLADALNAVFAAFI